jgi:putative transposase
MFLDDEDRQVYLRLLHKYAERYGVQISAYCLMTNHIHLIAIPAEDEAFANAIGTAHGQYATLFNTRHEIGGHLWHSRYFSCVLDESHFWNAIRYVELNPVRAGLARRAEDYPWSSAPFHCGRVRSRLVSELIPPKGSANWSSWLSEGSGSRFNSRLRQRTLAGLPCGSSEFVHEIEVQVGRPLEPRKRGRPPKDKNGDVSVFRDAK